MKPERQAENEPAFTWKHEMYQSQIKIAKRIKILEATGNVECTIRTKRNLAKLQKKIKETYELA